MYKSRYLAKIKAKESAVDDGSIKAVVHEALTIPILEAKKNAFDRAMDRYSISSAVMSTASQYWPTSAPYYYPRR